MFKVLTKWTKVEMVAHTCHVSLQGLCLPAQSKR